jgi:TorA maturation chaperone TorD
MTKQVLDDESIAANAAAGHADDPSIPYPLSRIPEPRSHALAFTHSLTPEDRARAEFYAVLARLYADAPDAALLRAIARAERMEGGTHLMSAWNRLLDASAAMDADAAAQEYTDLFIGVGKSEVNLHGSHWLSGFMMEKPLVELRSDLAALGLGRRDDVPTLEDHLSALFETMRLLVAGHDERKPAPVATQRSFFERHIASWAFRCCGAIRECAIANYYSRVAEFTEEFMALDRHALAMD